MGGMCLALAVYAGNFAVFAVIFCMAVSATSETHRGFAGVFWFGPFLCLKYVHAQTSFCCLALYCYLGTGLVRGVHHVHLPSGFGTGAG